MINLIIGKILEVLISKTTNTTNSFCDKLIYIFEKLLTWPFFRLSIDEILKFTKKYSCLVWCPFTAHLKKQIIVRLI